MQSDADWKELDLGAVIELKRGYDLPKRKRSAGVIPIVSSSGTSDYHSEAKVKGPGVVTGRYGTIGEVFYIESDFWPLNTTLYVSDFKGSHPRFIGYLLKTLDFGAYSDKAAVPGINRNHLHRARVKIPALEAQKAIAHVLGTLDSKIDLNRRINQTLEAMAQAIFKSWFVDFDPVKAKIAAIEQGEDPLRAAMRAISGKTDRELDQMPREQYEQLADTAALFPDEMEESELGEIPGGWEAVPLSNMIQLVGGGTPKRSEASYWNGTIPWFSVRDVPADGDVWVLDTEEKITEIGLKKSSTKLLREGTTIISARGTVGKLALVGEQMAMNQSCYGVVGAEGAGDYFNYFNLKEAVETLKRSAHGAVFDTITQATFETVISVSPSDLVMKRFEEVVGSLLKGIRLNVFQNQDLLRLRSALLPKLISGELKVLPNSDSEVIR